MSRHTPKMTNLCACVFVCVCVCSLSCVWHFVTPLTGVHQAPLSMEVSRQEYWNGLPFPPPRDLPNTGIKTVSLASSALAGGFFTTVLLGKPSYYTWSHHREKEQQHSCEVHGGGHEGSHQDMAMIHLGCGCQGGGRTDWESGVSR